MNKILSTFVILIVLSFSAIPTWSQKKTIRTQTTAKKVVDARLQPPAIRKFDHSLELTSVFDPFENQTKVTLRIQLNSIESMYMMFGFAGQTLKQSPKAILFQYFMDSEKIFFTPKEAIFLTDRDRFRVKLIGLPELDNGKVPFAASLDYPTFLRIANGETVAFKIGDTENYFDDEGLEAIKDFASRTGRNAGLSAETAQTNATKKELIAEVNKLRRLTPKLKDQIKTVLGRVELIQQALRKATSTNETDSEGIRLVGSVVPDLVEQLNSIPEGNFKDLVEGSIEDLIAGIMLAGGRIGVFDSTNPEFKKLLQQPTERNRLGDFPDRDHVSILLAASEEALSHATFIASSAGIVSPK